MRNIYSHVSTISACTPVGCRVQDVYEPRFNGSSLVLCKTGSFNIQDRINSFAPFTDLNYMLSRLKFGDSSVFCRSRPIYGDFSNLPDNPIDAINMVQSAERRFLELSVEERQNFGNDYRVWLNHIFTRRHDDSPAAGEPDSGTPDSSK